MFYNTLLHGFKRSLLRFSLISKTNQFLKYYYKIIFTNSTEIERFVNKCRFVSYDNDTKMFRVNKSDLSWPQKVSVRKSCMRELKRISPTSIKLRDISPMHYYDRCIERYIYERLCEHKENKDTCWYHDAQNNKCVGWYDPRKPFDAEGKRGFVKEKIVETEKPSWNVTESDIESFIRDDDGYVFLPSSENFDDDYKVLALVDSIQKYGFSNWISLSAPIVLGYSTTTKRYNALIGRHRIAALKYLQRQGVVNGLLEIMCHVLEYPYEALSYTRPYSDKCKRCMVNHVAIKSL